MIPSLLLAALAGTLLGYLVGWFCGWDSRGERDDAKRDAKRDARLNRVYASLSAQPQSSFSLVREGRATYATIESLSGASRRGDE